MNKLEVMLPNINQKENQSVRNKAYKKFHEEYARYFKKNDVGLNNRLLIGLLLHEPKAPTAIMILNEALAHIGLDATLAATATKMKDGTGGEHWYTKVYFHFHLHTKFFKLAEAADTKIVGRKINILDYFPKNFGFHKKTDRIFELVREYCSSVLEQYQHSKIAEQFDVFQRTERSGFWLLTAGAGFGKTTVMAKIVSGQLEQKNGRVVPYFFVQPLQKTKDRKFDSFGNDAKGFYNFLYDCLMQFYPEFSEMMPEKVVFDGDFFGLILDELYELKLVDRQKPLTIIVDGLDELQERDRKEHGENNPLGLPTHLPDGVFVAYSIRLSSETDRDVEQLITDEKLPLFHFHVPMEWGRFGDMHKAAMRNFVKQICAENGHVTYYNQLTSELERDTFVRSACERAGYNGVVLRCAFFEEGYWDSADNNGKDLSPDIDKYYVNYWRRMQQDLGKCLELDPVLCLSFDVEISETNYLRTTYNDGDESSKFTVTTMLEQWKRQGLILSRADENTEWIYPYHFTFREFLKNRSDATSHDKLTLPALRNLMSHVSLNELEAIERTDTIEVQKEWLKLWLRLSIVAENTNALQVVLNSMEAWRFFENYDSGITHIIGKASVISPRPRSSSQFESVLRNVANHLVDWTTKRKLECASEKRPYRYDELITLADGFGSFPTGKENELYLVEYLAEAGDQHSQSILQQQLNRITFLLAKHRRQRIATEFEIAKETLEEINHLIQNLDRQEYAPLWCRFFYERGYVAYLKGEYDKAASDFQQSEIIAKAAGNAAREWLGRYLFYFAEYFAGKINPDDYYRQLIALKDDYFEITEISVVDRGLWISFEWNLFHRLAVTAFECGHRVDFSQWVDVTLTHKVRTENLGVNSESHDLIDLQLRCQRSIMSNKYIEGVRGFLSYLGSLIDLIPSKMHPENDKVKDVFADVKKEHFAKDYRDFARLLLKTGIRGKRDIAKKLYELGLAEGEGFGNKRYIDDIKADLKKLS